MAEASAQKALAENLCGPVRAQRALRHPICQVHLGIIVPVIVIVILMKILILIRVLILIPMLIPI